MAGGKFAARAVTITCPPFSRGRSWLTAATAAPSSTLSRIISQVGLASSQRSAAAIFVASSRASFSGRSRISGAGERGEARVQARRVAGADEQERRIVGLARPSIFDREPRLAHPAEPMQRDRAALRGEKRRAQVFERFLAAGEQAAEREQRKIAGLCLRRRPRGDQRVEDRRGENLRHEIVGAGEWRAGIEVDRPEAAQVLGLRGARSVGRLECSAPRSTPSAGATMTRFFLAPSRLKPIASHASHCV